MTIDKTSHKELDSYPIHRKIVKIIVRFFLLIMFRVRYEGLQNIPADGPFILAANHTSMADIAVIQAKFKRWLYWVAKKELFHTPVIKYFMPRMGAIPVDRNKIDLTTARGIFSVLQAGRPIAMFPQGTRVEQNQINHILPKTGIAHFAIKTNSLIVPVGISGKFRFFAKIRVVVGEPFKLDADPKQKYRHEQLLDMSFLVMRKIYELIDFDYSPLKGDKKWKL